MLVRDTSSAVRRPPETLAVLNASGAAPLVLVCEHASNFIPAELHDLGVDETVRLSHVAWDPGALGVATGLSRLLDAPLLVQNVSRLVYDCNRPPSEPSAVPEKSEIYTIPGNEALAPAERDLRAARYYEPFRHELMDLLDTAIARHGAPLLATIHSFTPVYFGQPRAVEIGILHDEDARLADFLLNAFTAAGHWNCQRNQPYGPSDGVTHTLREHALPRGLANVMIEIRNDLIATAEAQEKMGAMLAGHLASAIDQFTETREEVTH
ncbi:MAG: N-formylglutamate amidohydrolase [Hyphomicrobiaceae bacterium]|nr:N-formylglutamate amidohydrolase [Hyphomicrobiaceae bacterium]